MKMKFLIIVTLVTVAMARPEAPPATKYGVPNGDSFNAGPFFDGNQGGNAAGNGVGSIGNSGGGFAGQLFQLVPVNANAGGQEGSGSFGGAAGFGQGGQGSFGAGAAAGAGSFGGPGSFSNAGAAAGSGQGGQGGFGQGSFGSGSGSFADAGAGSGSFESGQGSAQTQITKDVYVHIPPPEDSEEFAGDKMAPPVQKKHYKIIFIKAPSVSVQQQTAVQLASQVEEKTIVYVLVKKPELTPEITAEKSQNGEKNKPEVYFIKYKEQRQGGPGTGGPGFGNNNGNTYTPPAAHGGPYHK